MMASFHEGDPSAPSAGGEEEGTATDAKESPPNAEDTGAAAAATNGDDDGNKDEHSAASEPDAAGATATEGAGEGAGETGGGSGDAGGGGDEGVDEDSTPTPEAAPAAAAADSAPLPDGVSDELESLALHDESSTGGPGGDVPSEPHPESPPFSSRRHIVDPRTRTSSHSKLRSYEAHRRNAYTTKLNSSSLYWRAFRGLINAALDETRRAEVLVKAHTAADRAYGRHMKAIHENFLEEDGTPILDEKRRKKLLKQRGREDGDDEDEDGGKSGGTGGHGHGEVRKGFRLHDASNARNFLSDPSGTERRGAMLRQVEESCATLSDRFEEVADVMENDIVPEFSSLREQLEEEVVVMEALGDAILKELEEAEVAVTEAWEAYYDVAVKSLSGGDSSGTNRSKRQGASDASAEIITAVDDCHDVWVEEMRYRMSVAFLSACWEKASAELSRLFNTMKETECSRRFRLRELLITSLQRKERLFLSLPSVLTPVLKDLVNRPMDGASIEDDVQTSIRVRAQGIQREEVAERKHVPPGKGLTGVDATEGQFELSSPLMSDLLCKAKVIEKKTGGTIMSSWKTTLAVVTADSFLHLFEIPPNLKVQSGSAPEVAFHALVPPIEIPTEESVGGGGRGGGGGSTGPALSLKGQGGSHDAWSSLLNPSASVVLPNSTITFNDRHGNSAFEVAETYVTHGASKVFGKTGTRKIHLRTLTREETVDWISILKAPK